MKSISLNMHIYNLKNHTLLLILSVIVLSLTGVIYSQPLFAQGPYMFEFNRHTNRSKDKKQPSHVTRRQAQPKEGNSQPAQQRSNDAYRSIPLSKSAKAAMISLWNRRNRNPDKKAVSVTVIYEPKYKNSRPTVYIGTNEQKDDTVVVSSERIRGPAVIVGKDAAEKNGWTIFGSLSSLRRGDPSKATNRAEPPPRELELVTRFGEIDYLDSSTSVYQQYFPMYSLEHFTDYHKEQIFAIGHGVKVKAKRDDSYWWGRPELKEWHEVLTEKFTPEEQAIIHDLWYSDYGNDFRTGEFSAVRREVNRGARIVWEDFLDRNPNVPIDKLSENGLAQLRKSAPVIPRPIFIDHAGWGYDGNRRWSDYQSVTIPVYSSFARTDLGPILSFWGIGAHEFEHAGADKAKWPGGLSNEEIKGYYLANETGSVLAERILGIKVLQDTTGEKYFGGFLGVSKDNFKGSSKYARNYPGWYAIEIFERKFGELDPGSGKIQKLLIKNDDFQEITLGFFQYLLERHKHRPLRDYDQEDIKNDVLRYKLYPF